MRQCLPGVLWLVFVGVGPMVLGAATQPTLDELLGLETQPSVRETDQDEALAQLLEAPPGEDVLEQAIAQMDEVSRRLGRAFDAGLQTQRLEQEIIAKLEQVIAAARRQQSGSSGSGGSSSSARQPDSGSSDISGQVSGQVSRQATTGGEHSGQAWPGSAVSGRSDQRGIEELRSQWGHLPPRLRDELSEGLRERFSPQYRSLTEAYYQRLAEGEAQER